MSLSTLYNSLPTVEAASSAFKDRDETFAKLAPLFAAYQFQFGVCLVHAHCAIEEGEAMVANGNISRPQEPTKAPPAELIRDFQAIVGEDTVLGLFCPGTSYNGKAAPDGKTWLERTEGRDNIVELVDKETPDLIETAWLPGSDTPVIMMCSPFSHHPHSI